MDWRALIVAALIASAYSVWSKNATAPLSRPWFINGELKERYEGFVDQSISYSGHGAKSLKFLEEEDDGRSFATVVERFSADHYRGQRLRFSARVKRHKVTVHALLWMRIDDHETNALVFDNRIDFTPQNGTHDWQLETIVLDVPAQAATISHGIVLSGPGQVWIDDLQMDVVDHSVAVTAPPLFRPRLQPKPALQQ